MPDIHERQEKAAPCPHVPPARVLCFPTDRFLAVVQQEHISLSRHKLPVSLPTSAHRILDAPEMNTAQKKIMDGRGKHPLAVILGTAVYLWTSGDDGSSTDIKKLELNYSVIPTCLEWSPVGLLVGSKTGDVLQFDPESATSVKHFKLKACKGPIRHVTRRGWACANVVYHLDDDLYYDGTLYKHEFIVKYLDATSEGKLVSTDGRKVVLHHRLNRQQWKYLTWECKGALSLDCHPTKERFLIAGRSGCHVVCYNEMHALDQSPCQGALWSPSGKEFITWSTERGNTSKLRLWGLKVQQCYCTMLAMVDTGYSILSATRTMTDARTVVMACNNECLVFWKVFSHECEQIPCHSPYLTIR